MNFETRVALQLAQEAGRVGNFCDHAEHNEVCDTRDVISCGDKLIQIARSIAKELDRDLLSAYADRLEQIEERNPLFSGETLKSEALACRTLRDLQLLQVKHDREFHPDVIGLAKADQLRHYAFHIAKLAGSFADLALGNGEREDVLFRRFPDALLFGVKLHTVMGAKLSDEEVV